MHATANVGKDAEWYAVQECDATMPLYKTEVGSKKNYCTLKLKGTVTIDS